MDGNLRILPAHTVHPRNFRENIYVYPVLSRRSKGISVGVNLNPDKICNFDCVYCQVDRTTEPPVRKVDHDRLMAELEWTVDGAISGGLYADPAFSAVPASLRRLNDIAFSGDGEPTTDPRFEEIVQRVAEWKKQKGLDDVKIVLITNATMFHRPAVARGLDCLMQNNGEIWAKLDAGTAEYYQQIERTSIPFQRVLDNLLTAARRYPLVIQSLFLKYEGKPPASAEIDAYISRLEHIRESGGTLSLVQVYTVARTPAESCVASLSNDEVDAIAQEVERRLGIPAETYYGV